MTLEKTIEEAKNLKNCIAKIQEIVYYIPEFKESEVEFRKQTLKGFVCILQNDMHKMIRCWDEELLGKREKNDGSCKTLKEDLDKSGLITAEGMTKELIDREECCDAIKYKLNKEIETLADSLVESKKKNDELQAENERLRDGIKYTTINIKNDVMDRHLINGLKDLIKPKQDSVLSCFTCGWDNNKSCVNPDIRDCKWKNLWKPK